MVSGIMENTLHPEVWGTVADWSLIFITIVTAYFLFRTLQSQKEVQKTQIKLYEIESKRFTASIKPELNYTFSKQEFHTKEKHKRIITFEISNKTENLALSIYIDECGNDRIYIPTDYASIHKNNIKKDERPYLIHFLISTLISPTLFNFRVSYQDVAGTYYKQLVFCIIDNEVEIYPYLPDTINHFNT